MKRKKTSRNLCPLCGKGTTHFAKLNYKLRDQHGKAFVVRNLEVEVCDFCGQHIFNMSAVRKARQVQVGSGKIQIRLKPKIRVALAARARKNKRSISQEVHHLLESSLQATN